MSEQPDNDKTVINVLISSIYASFLGCIVVFVGMMINFLRIGGIDHLFNAVGGSLLFYFFASIGAIFLTLFVCGPIYVFLRKRNKANYWTASLIGLALSLVLVGFFPSVENLYWALAGVATGALFHYYFIKPKAL